MDNISALPVELLLEIAKHLEPSSYDDRPSTRRSYSRKSPYKNLLALSRTCQGIYRTIDNYIYKLEVRNPSPDRPRIIFWAAENKRLLALKKCLLAGANPDEEFRVDLARHPRIKSVDSACLDQKFATSIEVLQDQIRDRERQEKTKALSLSPFDIHRVHKYSSLDSEVWGWGSCLIQGSALHLAARCGFADGVKLLISSKALLDTPSRLLCPCFNYVQATEPGRKERLRAFWTPLHVAICMGQVGVARTLLEHGACIENPFAYMGHGRPGVTALHTASARGYLELVQLLVDGGYQTDLEARDAYHSTPLCYAFNHGHDAVVNWLRSRGATTHVEFVDKSILLVNAILAQRYRQVIDLGLLDDVKDVNAYGTTYDDTSGMSLLHLCCYLDIRTWDLVIKRAGPPLFEPREEIFEHAGEAEPNAVAIIQKLIAVGADVHARDSKGRTALFYAARSQKHLFVEILLKNGAQVEAMDCDGFQPLQALCGAERSRDDDTPETLRTAQLLLAAGADIRHETHDGKNALALLFLDSHYDTKIKALAEFLIQNGLDLNQPIHEGSKDFEPQGSICSHDTILSHLLSARRDSDLISLVLELGGKSKPQDAERMISVALADNCFKSVDCAIVLFGADTQFLSNLDTYKDALRCGSYSAAHQLVYRGLSVSAVDDKGMTALHHACLHLSQHLVRNLLHRGADLEALDNDGHRPGDLVSLAIVEGVQHDGTTRILQEDAWLSSEFSIISARICTAEETDSDGVRAHIHRREYILDILSRATSHQGPGRA
jgi:ankyrin repeat protein